MKKKAIAFNQVDKSGPSPVNRVSYLGTYQIVDGLPRYTHGPRSFVVVMMLMVRNPTGRTGFAGRGLLDYWGPNHIADPIFSR